MCTMYIQSVTTLKPLTAELNGVNHAVTMQRSAEKLWVQEFMWLLLWHPPKHRPGPSVVSSAGQNSLTDTGQDCKNHTGMARGTQRRARCVLQASHSDSAMPWNKPDLWRPPPQNPQDPKEPMDQSCFCCHKGDLHDVIQVVLMLRLIVAYLYAFVHSKKY